MDKSHYFRNSKERPSTASAHGHLIELQKQVSQFERQKEIFLLLSNDITQVRAKNDLVNLFSARIKPLFRFSHTIVMLIDAESNSYSPFLLDPVGSIIKDHQEYQELTTSKFSLNEPIVGKILHASGPLHYHLDEILNSPGLPSFVRVNYECGVKEMLITPLKNKNEVIGFSLIYADIPGVFSPDFQDLMLNISPQLSNAVTNIMINEQIRQKQFINSVLLELSTEMVVIRERKSLLNVINSCLKKLIPFSSCMMTVLNPNGKTYHVFLTESEEADFNKLSEAAAYQPYPVADGIYDAANVSDTPLVIDMRSVNLTKAPLWFKLNYSAGAREMLIKVLHGEKGQNHSLILFSNRLQTFGNGALAIIERIAGELATVAENIIANEQITKKEWETSFLLDFGNAIATVRSKEDLAETVMIFLKKLNVLKGYAIRLINDDGKTTTTYIHDVSFTLPDDPLVLEATTTRLPINDGIQDRVLNSEVPVFLTVDEEMAQGRNPRYFTLWNFIGFKKVVGMPLKTASKKWGILWLGLEEINMPLVQGICSLVSISISNIKAHEQMIIFKKKLEYENEHLNEQLNNIYNFSEIVGDHEKMHHVYQLITRVAGANSSVLILGETGTGKELIARAIHQASPRKNKLMIKVNCAAMPANLIESELFGHEKGAFTGAFERRTGKFELAHNSTLFLDEIGELPIELQVKLLRVIQEREFERIGGKNTIKVDVRIITATNRNLEDEMTAGRFRPDLYYRLNVFPILLPPLRERKQDVVPLANFFLARYSKQTGITVKGMTPDVARKLQNYEWPGNVRELEHLIERSVLLANSNTLREVYLPGGKDDLPAPELSLTLDARERYYIIGTLRRCCGKIGGEGGAAEILDIPATTLHSKMKRLNITKEDYR
ncbi:sigma-54-dependent Fis family transcriptional regulator [Mucilaginibacter aquaedulcis]|uniref:sigma-54-dependent Fis family transcriptional regulator n=1 Tax=Mucilaginibacter aquaedulcis TaxID=1187081 RepID=UPI0025B4DC16|nr:sigma 54-interacting transcriptional regulator [Mucilaginibacter aquaedulcis]MDN3551532.1 sigma 54-interacting transcriptional regulator [Mucilaginibacter aquaedulcis]